MSSLTRCIFLFFILETRYDQLQATDVISTLTGSGWIRAETNSGTDELLICPGCDCGADSQSASPSHRRLPNQIFRDGETHACTAFPGPCATAERQGGSHFVQVGPCSAVVSG